MMTNNIEVAAMLKRASAFLPYRPIFCLKELSDLKELNLLQEATDRASSHLIEGKAYLEIDELSQALLCFKRGLKIGDDDEVLNLELKMHKVYILGRKKKKNLEKSKDDLLALVIEFRDLEEGELAAKADLYYGKLLVVNSEFKEALTVLKKNYFHAIDHKFSFIEADSCQQIVEIYSSLGNLNTLEATKWADKLFAKNDELGLQKGEIISTIQLAKLQASRAEYAESRLSFNKALKLLDESGVFYKTLYLEVLTQLSHSYLNPDMENAVKSYSLSCKAMDIAEKLDYYPGLPHILLGMTKVLSRKDACEFPFSPLMDDKWMEEKLMLAEENIDESDLKTSKALWKACANYYRHKGDTEKAFYYMDKLMESTDRLSEKEKATSIDLLEEKNREQEEEIEQMEKELEEKDVLEELNDLLEKTVSKRTTNLKIKNQELREYAYIVAHDLKEPIRTIVGFTKILEKRIQSYANSGDLELFEFIKNAGIRMNELVEGLLKYSTLNMEENDLSITDFNKMVNMILADIRYSIEENDAKIDVSKLPEALPVNKLMMKQVFQNLISNAIKFKEEGKKSVIKIDCQTRPNDYLFSISDNGIGIGKSYHKIIFKLFNRLHKNKGYKGTGIGLSVSKKIIELHGGEIWLESEEGVGTTFFFTLPR